MKASSFLAAALNVYSVFAATIQDINGKAFLSPLKGQNVTDVAGIITAKSSTGFFIRSPKPDKSKSFSDSLFVFSSSAGRNLTVGDSILLDGRVSEFRSAAADLFITEISSPRNIRKLSSNNTVSPILVGRNGRRPPTKQFSALDNGDVFGYPNNQSQISVKNPELQPGKYGLDFWESLFAELVVITSVTAINRPNSFRETWVRGDWPVTGLNSRGGLTMTDKDANPETIIIGSPLDGTRNPTTIKLGDQLADITGVIYWQFGFYYILPLTAIKITKPNAPLLPPPTTLVSTKSCSGLTFGDYNVENMSPTDSKHISDVAGHIVDFLKTPDLLFIQEIQDNSGPTDNGIVDSNLTLSNLIAAISSKGNVTYSATYINPVNDRDGGQPGGNIRQAYLFDPKVIRLHKPNPGSSTDANEVITTPDGPELKFNPGRIDPNNFAAWNSSRKPLAAAWETLDGKNKFFTVNVHFASKGGSSSLEGDLRPPVNGVIDPRIIQANVTASFIAQIVAADKSAKVISAGDFNEFTFVKPLEVYEQVSGSRDLDVVFKVPKVERYTYMFDMSNQQLDHMYVSRGVHTAGGGYEHIHVNTWADTAGSVSDHDPSVAKLNVCEKKNGGGGGSQSDDLEPLSVDDSADVPEV